MGIFGGLFKALENIMAGRELELWSRNSGTTLMEAIEITLRRGRKYPIKFTTAAGKQGLMYHPNSNFRGTKIYIVQYDNSNIGFSVFYPVNTSHLTSYAIKGMIDDAKAHCEGGFVTYDEESQLLSYVMVFDLSKAELEGVSVDLLLHEVNARTKNALNYFDQLQEQHKLSRY